MRRIGITVFREVSIDVSESLAEPFDDIWNTPSKVTKTQILAGSHRLG